MDIRVDLWDRYKTNRRTRLIDTSMEWVPGSRAPLSQDGLRGFTNH